MASCEGIALQETPKEGAAMIDWLTALVDMLPWYAWVAMVAIICSSWSSMAKASHRHQERMALIRQGKDPERHTRH